MNLRVGTDFHTRVSTVHPLHRHCGNPVSCRDALDPGLQAMKDTFENFLKWRPRRGLGDEASGSLRVSYIYWPLQWQASKAIGYVPTCKVCTRICSSSCHRPHSEMQDARSMLLRRFHQVMKRAFTLLIHDGHQQSSVKGPDVLCSLQPPVMPHR